MKKPSKKTPVPATENRIVSARNQVAPLMLLLALSLLFYLNTLYNEYALDDYLVISKNSYTQQGLAGIPDLISKTSYYGFFKNNNEEATLRYRPLVMITFALECAWVKNESLRLILSHLVNVLIFAGTIWCIFRLLNDFLFPDKPEPAFMATLLFVIHPVHTESIANIKGRDELLSFFFCMLSALYLFRFRKNNNLFTYIISVVCFAAGLFSKESTLSFLPVIPVMLYFFSDMTYPVILKRTIPYALMAALFIWIRFNITGWSHPASDNILNNPFIQASFSEKYATIIWCLGYYLRLLFFPHPLTYDYTFNQIKLTGFDNTWVILSLIVHLMLIILMIWGLRKKAGWAFGILYYFISILLISNLVVNLGAFIGERLIYAPSFGFCITLGIIFTACYSRIEKKAPPIARPIKYIFLCLLVAVAGIKTISRNADWKNNYTLMTGDVRYSSESMKANDACAINLILESDKPGLTEEERIKLLSRAIYHDHKAAEIMPSFTDIYINLGTSFSRLGNVDSTAFFWNLARSQKPDHEKLKELDPVLAILYLKRGLQKAVDHDMTGSLLDLEKAVGYDPLNAEAWYNFGGALFSVKRYTEARKAFEKTVAINPAHQQALQALSSLGRF